MTREEIIAMAREAGFIDSNAHSDIIVRHSNGSWVSVHDILERFAELVAAKEREECAVLCDEMLEHWSDYKDTALLNGDVSLSIAASGEPRAAEALASLIRARGSK